MASVPTLLPKLKMTPEAIKKRDYRAVEKEKKRRAYFIQDYVRIKYPEVFKEVNAMYLDISKRYPGKSDLTKLYYLKKWEAKMKSQQNDLLVPHLAVLTPPQFLQPQSSKEKSDEVPPVEAQRAKEKPDEVPPVEAQRAKEKPDQVPPVEMQSNELMCDGVLPAEDQCNEVHLPDIQQSIDVVTSMTLNEMELTVQELTNALQRDQELMDLVEGFDLPDSVWDNELALPDYVLESDLQW